MLEASPAVLEGGVGMYSACVVLCVTNCFDASLASPRPRELALWQALGQVTQRLFSGF